MLRSVSILAPAAQRPRLTSTPRIEKLGSFCTSLLLDQNWSVMFHAACSHVETIKLAPNLLPSQRCGKLPKYRLARQRENESFLLRSGVYKIPWLERRVQGKSYNSSY